MCGTWSTQFYLSWSHLVFATDSFRLHYFYLFFPLFFAFICFYFLFNYLKFFYSAVLVSAIQQCNLAIIIHTSPSSLDSLTSLLPISPGHHRAPDWAPCITQQLLTNIQLTPDSVHMLMLPSPSVPLSASPTMSTSPLSKSASSVFSPHPPLQVGSSIFF